MGDKKLGLRQGVAMIFDPLHPLIGQVICVDGPSASGKGTLAKHLARAYRLKFLDTGVLYRSVAWLVLDAGADPADPAAAVAAAQALAEKGLFDFKHIGNNKFSVYLKGRDVTDEVRGPQVSGAASVVARQLPVRAALLDMQQSFAAHWKDIYGVVLDGRDTGGRIAPEAGLKIFLTASPEARAERRQREFAGMGKEVPLAEVLADLAARDERDRVNTIQTPDSLLVDASAMDAKAVLAHVYGLIEQRFGVRPVQE